MSEFNKNHHLLSDTVFDVSSKYALLVVIFIFIISCSNKEDNGNSTSSVTVTPGIKVVNSSSRFNTSDITVLTKTASSKMSNQAANILAVSWDLGSTSQTSDSRNENFNTYNVVISSSDIDAMMSEITAWFDTTCMTSEDKTEQTTRFRNYMTYGADVASHYDVCGQYRIVLVATQNNKNLNEFKHVWFHELYHAFQHDLSDETCSSKRNFSDSNGKEWMIEGSADYFARMLVHGDNGTQVILGKGLEAYNANSDKTISGDSVATRGAAGFQHMIEKNSFSQSSILDGSFFHNCKSETDYTDSNSAVASAESSESGWWNIELISGVYNFR